jgi:2-polyprenyl-6-methoxyphenol hydroxylase-like FAD-dependent oxidoreductase
VTVHERNPTLREIGAGISLRENGLQALEAIGAFAEATEDGEQITHWELRDERSRVLAENTMTDNQRFFTVTRPRLHRALVNAAKRAGAEIRTGSLVTAASPGGELTLADGQLRTADLIIGADGIYSTVRSSLQIPTKITDLQYMSRRTLISRRAADPGGVFPGYWSGSRRMAISGCGPEHLYVFMFCTPRDRRGYADPDYRRSWIEAFPQLSDVIERLPDEAEWRPIHEVRCPRWWQGRTALIGDSAHAMAPTLGQGACISMSSAVALAAALERFEQVQAALEHWEASQRSVIDATQRYGRRYIWLMTHWPKPVLNIRSALVRFLTRSQALQERLNGRPSEVRVCVEVPTGTGKRR